MMVKNQVVKKEKDLKNENLKLKENQKKVENLKENQKNGDLKYQGPNII